MNLRSLRLVNFRGARDLTVRELAREGVTRVPLPADAEPGMLVDAVTFALSGEQPAAGPAMARGEGFAYVEAGLRLPGDARASVFRGLDRRGNVQASLREAGGQRVTGGAEGVARRLAELVGGDLTDYLRAAAVRSDADLPVPGGPAVASSPARAAAADAAERAVQGFCRALRAERLRDLAQRRHEELLAIGRRLRRSREEVASRGDRLNAERDRARTRLGRVNEYRDIAAREETHALRATGERSEESWSGRVAEWGLGTVACALLLVLAWVTTEQGPVAGSEEMRAYLGLAWIAAVALFLVVVASRHRRSGRFIVVPDNGDRPAEPADAWGDTWRTALRQRFADLEDPDDPALPQRLRDRMSEADAELVPLLSRMEKIDDALALADVETGRSARALHLGLPVRDLGETGLQPDESPEDAARAARACGDAAYQAAVERDALLADRAADVTTARRTAEDALGALAAVVGDGDALAASRDRIAGARVGHGGADEEQRLEAVLLADVRAAADGAVAPGDAAGDEIGALVSTLSGGAYTGLARDSGGRVVLSRSDGVKEELATVDPGLRGRLEIACRVAAARGGGDGVASGPEFIVLDRVPAGLTDADLVTVVHAVAPHVRQIIAGDGAADAIDASRA